MKFAIIGTGFINPKHVEAIFNVMGKITDVVNATMGEDKWKEVVSKTDADCVVILAPNDLHFPMAKMAAERGKIVICEKPLTINSQEARELSKYPNIFTVLPLRYHRELKNIKENVASHPTSEVEMDISVYRDPEYYAGWKGKKERSGGVLFNLGVHYFDILLHVFGKPDEVKLTHLDNKTGVGYIKGKNYKCNFRVSTDAKRENQRRVFKINGEQYNFSPKDNLAYENLHQHIYDDMLKGKGVTPEEALPSIELIESLYESFKTE